MPEMLFCYCCQTHHPKDRMRLFNTRSGRRWRCISSIEAAFGSTQERDSFGRRQTEINQESGRRGLELAQQAIPERRFSR